VSRAHSQHPSKPAPADPPRHKRRALADGPAVRAALAAVASEPANPNGGWKLLDGPPATAGSKSSRSATRDLTQPDASFRVVSDAAARSASTTREGASAAPDVELPADRPPLRTVSAARNVPRPESKSLRRVTPTATPAAPPAVLSRVPPPTRPETPPPTRAQTPPPTRAVTPPPMRAVTPPPMRAQTPPPTRAVTPPPGRVAGVGGATTAVGIATGSPLGELAGRLVDEGGGVTSRIAMKPRPRPLASPNAATATSHVVRAAGRGVAPGDKRTWSGAVHALTAGVRGSASTAPADTTSGGSALGRD
jgi:hypothetical protein